ncbi:hypothetical protein PSEUBRA_004628 [Kalmanozyma brasiliensis GHG001]|uniref:uncharacterized protein n=1 Tax=Kalmanozyma brasiliensis (strain GHG001) TaxID=1365824 RepID=UPI002867B304|nr:uncharacterized protein PSEUBRA_004628 [Kalmanozyma brasiliensis GHG001]KAF6767395.1 hypothetical protein PSEUBRA_004628 [Kalmanozyma brasiliensis GHG001]
MKLILLLFVVCRVVALPRTTPDTALAESPRPFDPFAQLDAEIASAAKSASGWGVAEKWTAGVVAGLTTLVNGAYEVGYALNLADRHRHASELQALRSAVGRANAAAQHRSDRPGGGKAKRADESLVELAREREGFEDALSRFPSGRLADDARETSSIGVNDRLTALEAAVLRQKQNQLQQAGHIPTYVKVLTGMGVGNALIAAAAAEMSLQDTLEMHSRTKELPDVRNSDRKTCERFKGEVEGLDCEKAKGTALS